MRLAQYRGYPQLALIRSTPLRRRRHVPVSQPTRGQGCPRAHSRRALAPDRVPRSTLSIPIVQRGKQVTNNHSNPAMHDVLAAVAGVDPDWKHDPSNRLSR